MYDSSFSLRDEFDRAKLEARLNDVGLWDFEDDSSPSESHSKESESDSSGEVDVPPVPDDGQAQYVLENTAGDPHQLNSDSDGVTCETPP